MDDREPSITLAWLFILLFLPVVGVVFYIFFGRDWKVVAQRNGWVRDLRETEKTRDGADLRAQRAGGRPVLRGVGRRHGRAHLARDLRRTWPASSRPRPSSSTTTAPPSSRASRRTWPAPSGSSTCSTSSGSRTTSPPSSRRSCSTASRPASRCASCTTGWAASRSRSASSSGSSAPAPRCEADVTDILRINYRNHRKIVVIDGEIGYTGGMNVGQEYIDGGKRFATWRDTHVRMTGQAVAALEKLYAARWFERKQNDHENLFGAEVHAGARPGRRRERARSWRWPRRGSRTPGARPAARTWWPSARPRSRCGSSRRTSCPTTASTT